MHENTVARVLNYERVIEPYRYIKIYAGVGSGKTYFACKMVTGTNNEDDFFIPKKTVMLNIAILIMTYMAKSTIKGKCFTSIVNYNFNMAKLIDMLEDNDDVQNVWHNWENMD